MPSAVVTSLELLLTLTRNASTAGNRRLRRAGASAANDATSAITVATVSSIAATERHDRPHVPSWSRRAC
jgi:hypothetical protein